MKLIINCSRVAPEILEKIENKKRKFMNFKKFLVLHQV
jgi:hypothetical protein